MDLPCKWPSRGFAFRVSGPGIEEVPSKPTEHPKKDVPSKDELSFSSFPVKSIAPPDTEHTSMETQQLQQNPPFQSVVSGASADSSSNARHQNAQSIQSPLELLDGFSGFDNVSDWLPQMSDTWSWSPLEPMTSQSPDLLHAYYPNAEYRALHDTLYTYMVDMARAEGTKQGTPVSVLQDSASTSDPVNQLVSNNGTSYPALTAQRERELWSNYLDEVTDWLDMFDNDNHFKIVLPTLAQKSRHLRLAILALSSRQLERKDPNKPYVESLGLYSEAIQLINDQLSSMDTTVIASCVLLCVLEMMSSSPNEWARHLDGCAMLLTAAGIHGAVGGMKQAIFWCFARMDLWRGYLTDSNTKIPTSLWYFPNEELADSMARLQREQHAYDQYANFSTFLCASALQRISASQDAGYVQRWDELNSIIEQWYESRPSQMRPVFTSFDKTKDTFPIIVFSNPPAISGNQMFHSASLLMLQAKPKRGKTRSSKSTFWHARQIVGISASNCNHGAWTNAPQSLWIAGRLMSHPEEHRVVLETLHNIERETGFATAWRAEDLKNHWGNFDSE